MKSRESELIMVYMITDLIVLNLSVILIASISPVKIGFQDYFNLRSYLLHANLSWIVTYFIFVKKNLFVREGFISQVKRITNRVLIFIVVALILAYFFMPRSTYSRIFLLEYATAFYVGKLLCYYLFYRYLKFKREKGIHVRRVIIVGRNTTSRLLHNLIKFNPSLGYKFIGYVADEKKNDEILGNTENLEQVMIDHSIEMVFVTLSLFNDSLKSKDILRLCNKLGVRLRFVPENQQWFKNRVNMESVGQLVLINPQEIPLDIFESQFYKRSFDVVFSTLVILLILSWLIPILSLMIKLNSKGPVFFVQKRTGINNRTFKCLKFRSMQVNKDSDTKQATADDNRITVLGNFLRKSNIDELPQFLNVWLGQMSVVGPRPHMLKHTEQYSALIDSYMVRHYIRPGITGWAQVRGYRGETDELWKMKKRVQYDMNYLENWNFWWDLKIIMMTFLDVIPYKPVVKMFIVK